MEKQTEYRMGNRCHVCTGCGQCQGEKQNVHVLAEASREIAERVQTNMSGDSKTMCHISGERLIIADIGTTTVAMQLYGNDGSLQDTFVALNPQAEYGADVLSRIQAAKNPENARRMQRMIRDVLRQGIQQFRGVEETGEKTRIREEQRSASNQESLRMVIAANTTMTYLLMGYETTELGEAPFRASHLQEIETVVENVPCYILPGVSAFVGGDIVAGILACGMHEKEEIQLLIDLGTNGEIVLGNKDKMIACATAAGPAFEGGANRGVWGADMISLLAKLRREGIVDETGLLAPAYFEEGVQIGNVRVTQEAIRAVQLAKGAIVAGVRILVQKYDIAMEQIDKVVLAGGFGYYLNPRDAARIGLLPEEFAEKAVSGGNTAMAGALCLGRKILNGERENVAQLVKEIQGKTVIYNLAETEEFQQVYFASMDLD